MGYTVSGSRDYRGIQTSVKGSILLDSSRKCISLFFNH